MNLNLNSNKINPPDRYAPGDFFVPEALRASGGTRELRSSLLILPPLRYGENQEFEQMPLRGTAQLGRAYGGRMGRP